MSAQLLEVSIRGKNGAQSRTGSVFNDGMTKASNKGNKNESVNPSPLGVKAGTVV